MVNKDEYKQKKQKANLISRQTLRYAVWRDNDMKRRAVSLRRRIPVSLVLPWCKKFTMVLRTAAAAAACAAGD